MVSKSIVLLRVYRKCWVLDISVIIAVSFVWNNFQKFMDDVLRLSDVYFVTSYQVIEWMRKPTSLSAIETFKPWQCNLRKFHSFELACDLPTSCKLPSKVLKSYRYLHTCFECPKEYPWLRNEFGMEWFSHSRKICVNITRKIKACVIKLFIYYKKCVYLYFYTKNHVYLLYKFIYTLYDVK